MRQLCRNNDSIYYEILNLSKSHDNDILSGNYEVMMAEKKQQNNCRGFPCLQGQCGQVIQRFNVSKMPLILKSSR